MPIIFQHSTSNRPLLAVWKIAEAADYFSAKVPLNRSIAHPQVQLRHLAARFILDELMPGFPYENIEIAPSGKPFLPGNDVQFSLTHCGDYAAAILSGSGAVGIDLEATGDRIFRIRHKFLSDEEQELLRTTAGLSDLQEGPLAAQWLTRAWSAKESVYKWHGEAGIDFTKDIQLVGINLMDRELHFKFAPIDSLLQINYHSLEDLELTWIEY